MENLGFIGLGEMGLPMALNLQKAGYQVYAFEVDKSRCRHAAQGGIISCRSPGEVALKADKAVISMVRDFRQTQQVLFGQDGVAAVNKDQMIVIVMSTLDPSSLNKLDTSLAERGCFLLDAPVSGAKSGAEAGTLTIMAAGKAEIMESCQDYFKVMGKNTFNCGSRAGAGQAVKLANNLVLAINMAAFTEGLRLADSYGLNTNTFCDLIKVSTGNSWVAQNWEVVKTWWEQDQPNTTLDIVYKDLFAILKDCGETHCSLPLGGLTFNLLMDALKKS